MTSEQPLSDVDEVVVAMILTPRQHRKALELCDRLADEQGWDWHDAPWIFTVHPIDYDLVQPWVEGYEVTQVFFGFKWLEVSLSGE